MPNKSAVLLTLALCCASYSSSAYETQRPKQPPQEAIDACQYSQEADVVSFTTPHGHAIEGICTMVNNQLIAIPQHHARRHHSIERGNNMNINGLSSSNTMMRSNDVGQRPPPPEGKRLPRELEAGIATLSESEQAEVSELLSSFTPEQHDELRDRMESFRSDTQQMNAEELGSAFLSAIQSVAGVNQASHVNSHAIVDTYA